VLRPNSRRQTETVEVMAVAVATADRSYLDDRAGLGAAIGTGVLWGVVAAAVMAMYAMIAGLTYLNSGFFTPMYHIASTVIAPEPMMTSMQKAMEGETNFYFTFGPAAVGMMIHFATGIAYGVLFALIARAVRLSGAVAVGAGIVYGAGVLLFSSFIGLPIAAAVLDGGDPIADMPQMVGWTTFTIEHLMFGAILGVGWIAARRKGSDRGGGGRV
jgi:uncharacterized membrane protein YagU involved in acid resistance